MTAMVDSVAGGCMCGAVRYALSEPIRFALFCHCRDCQRITGTGHSALFGAARSTTQVTGALLSFDYPADSGAAMTSSVCARCGNPVFKLSSRHDSLYFFHAATLDHPELFSPRRAVWTRRAQPWDAWPAALPAEP